MDIDQLPPKKPNFLLILILFGVSIILIFVLTWAFLRGDSNHLGFMHHTAHPTSRLLLPSVPGDKLLNS